MIHYEITQAATVATLWVAIRALHQAIRQSRIVRLVRNLTRGHVNAR